MTQSVSLAVLRRFIIIVAILNWRALPGWWHIETWWTVPRLHFNIRTRGLRSAISIGQSPFKYRPSSSLSSADLTLLIRRSIITKGVVTLDKADWNMHMSNSSYPRVLDQARFQWLLEVCGPALGQEGVWSPLGGSSCIPPLAFNLFAKLIEEPDPGTAFSFFKELPILHQYEIDTHVVSWDEKWVSG